MPKRDEALGVLTEIKGVGPATAEKLLNKFKTLAKVAAADKEALLKVGVPAKTVTNVLRWGKKVPKPAAAPKAKKKATPKPAPKAKPKPRPAAATKVPAVLSVPEPPVAKLPKAKEAAKPAVPPIPLPFGSKDVTVRTTPPPEVIGIKALPPVPETAPVAAPEIPEPPVASGASGLTRQQRRRRRTKRQERRALRAKRRAARAKARPVAPAALAVPPGLAGPVKVAVAGKPIQDGFVNLKDTVVRQGQRVFKVYDSTGKVALGYALQMRGLYYVQG